MVVPPKRWASASAISCVSICRAMRSSDRKRGTAFKGRFQIVRSADAIYHVPTHYALRGSYMPEIITSIGEILIDFLPIVEQGTTTGFRMHVGGSPYNVAMGVARLGQPVAFAGKIATDFFGRYMRAHAEAEGIDTRFLIDADVQSTLAFVAYEDGDPA